MSHHNQPGKCFNGVLLILFFFCRTIVSEAQTTNWTGAEGTKWSAEGNWDLGIPSTSTNVVIPSGLTNYPIIDSGTGAAADILIQPGASLTVDAATLKIGGAITNDGFFTTENGTIEMTGSGAQTIAAGIFNTNTVKNLVISNVAGVSLAGPLRVTGTLSFGNVNNSIFSSNGFLTLVSTATNTARVADITNSGANTGNQVNGAVTVERYITAKRAFRFLTAPVNSSASIRANWMEGTNNDNPYVNYNPALNYGTHITGAGGGANGFDATQTNNPSLFTFDNTTQAWVAAPNTDSLFAAGNAYRILVRGSRSVDLNSNVASPSVTVLRAAGTIVTGPVTMAKAGAGGTAGLPELSSAANSYSFIGNPYPSTVNWLTVVKTDVSSSIYLFDPTISGSYGRGAYVSYNTVLHANSNSSSYVDNYLQSGVSFFVQSAGPNPSITFKETDKSSAQRAIFRTADGTANLSVQLLLPSMHVADATAVYFSDAYGSSIGDEDSYKFTNQDENIAILRNGVTLSLEGRKPVITVDSVPLKMWQLTQKTYTLRIALNNFGDNVEGYLQDKYLNATTPLAHGETLVPFSIIDEDTASVSAERFKIMFKTVATLPVRISGIKAYANKKGVQVDWVAESESNLEAYEVERSADGQRFETIGLTKTKNDPGIASAYSFFDINPVSGDNYYRIKSVGKSGDVKVSEVVKVGLASGKTGISVVNNPVGGKLIELLFNNVTEGNYLVRLINASGEKVYEGKINHPGGVFSTHLDFSGQLAAGVYQLQVINGSLNKTLQAIIQ